MKKIFSLVAAAAAAAMMVSCEIVESDINPLGYTELSDYAGKLFSNSVLLPVEIVDVAIAIDEYLALPEEQRTDHHYTVRAISDNVYQVYDKNMSCTVDTGGDSVWEDGAEWKYLSFVMTIQSLPYRDGAWRTSLTDDVYLTFNADAMGQSLLMVLVEMPGGKALMALNSREGGHSDWNMSVEGTDVGSNGLRAEYGTRYDTGGIHVTREIIEHAPEEEGEQKAAHKSYNGLFFVDIYENGSRIDWVEMILDSSSTEKHITASR